MVSKRCFYVVLFIRVYVQSVNVGGKGGGAGAFTRSLLAL